MNKQIQRQTVCANQARRKGKKLLLPIKKFFKIVFITGNIFLFF